MMHGPAPPTAYSRIALSKNLPSALVAAFQWPRHNYFSVAAPELLFSGRAPSLHSIRTVEGPEIRDLQDFRRSAATYVP